MSYAGQFTHKLIQAIRYRQKAIAKMNQPLKSANTARPIGTVGGVSGVTPALKSDKAARCEAKALEYERKGNLAKAQRNREKAWRIREKNAIPHPVGTVPPLGYSAATGYSGTGYTNTAYPAGTVPMNNMNTTIPASTTVPMTNSVPPATTL